jgi:hypothetical protein
MPGCYCNLLHLLAFSRPFYPIVPSLQCGTRHADLAFRSRHTQRTAIEQRTATVPLFCFAYETISFCTLAASGIIEPVHYLCSSRFSIFAALFGNVFPLNSARR